jgi:hypothetical protein
VLTAAATDSVGPAAARQECIANGREARVLMDRTAHAITAGKTRQSATGTRIATLPCRCRMPWKCPACQTQIAHNGDAPEPRRVYRCHVCRLELILDEGSQKLTLAPLWTTVSRRVTDAEP